MRTASTSSLTLQTQQPAELARIDGENSSALDVMMDTRFQKTVRAVLRSVQEPSMISSALNAQLTVLKETPAHSTKELNLGFVLFAHQEQGLTKKPEPDVLQLVQATLISMKSNRTVSLAEPTASTAQIQESAISVRRMLQSSSELLTVLPTAHRELSFKEKPSSPPASLATKTVMSAMDLSRMIAQSVLEKECLSSTKISLT